MFQTKLETWQTSENFGQNSNLLPSKPSCDQQNMNKTIETIGHLNISQQVF